MTPQTRETVRTKLLLLLAAASELGLSDDTLHTQLRLAGLQVTPDEARAETVYLVDKGLVAAVDKQISPELRRTRITADGRDMLAQQGF